MNDFVSERAQTLGLYIAEEGATVRQAAQRFGVSKGSKLLIRRFSGRSGLFLTKTKASVTCAAEWLQKRNTKTESTD